MYKSFANIRDKILNYFGFISKRHAEAMAALAFIEAKQVNDARLAVYLKSNARELSYLHKEIEHKDGVIKTYKDALQFVGRDSRCCCTNVAREVARKALEKYAKA